MGVRQGDGRCWYGRGWNAVPAHSCDGKLDVGNGFGECGVGGNQVFDSGIFLNGCICQIVEERCNLLCLFEFSSLIRTKRCITGSHVDNIPHLGKGSSLIGLPIGPSVVNDRATFPLVPGQCHVAARQGMLGTCGDHGFVGDGDTGIGSKDLTFLLISCVDGKGGGGGVDARIEVGHVAIQIRLADLGVGVEDVHD
jgi:hypothetical protein